MKPALLLLLALASPLRAAAPPALPAIGGDPVLDQDSPYANAWLYCYDATDVWQQQVRAGTDGLLAAFEVAVVGPAGAQVELRLRAGDGWSAGPALWSGSYAKATDHEERPTFDVLSAGIALSAGDAFVLEAFGDTAGELRGSWVHAAAGPPLYPEELYLSGPVCYDDCQWRIGVKTWMVPAQASVEVVRLGVPPNPPALLPGVGGGPAIGQAWRPAVDHAAFAPTAVLDVLALAGGPFNESAGAPGLAGTLLCDPATVLAVVPATPGAPFVVPVPSDASLVGLALCTQAAALDAGGAAELTNALDVVVGTF